MPTPRRPRRRNDSGGGGGDSSSIVILGGSICERISLLQLLGFIFALFALAVVFTILGMPDDEPHNEFFRSRHIRGDSVSDGGSVSSSDIGTASSSIRSRGIRGPLKTSSNDNNDGTQRDANGNLMDLLTIRYTPAAFPIDVPPSTWPVPKIDLTDKHGTYPTSSQSSVYEYEYIIHPGDDRYKMTVPKFWTRPLHNKMLMEHDLAMQIGTCTSAGEDGNHGGRGKACPPDERTIFVALASYRDYQCRETLDSIFARAKHPERIRVAVVDQRDTDDLSCVVPIKPCNRGNDQAICKHANQIEKFEMESDYAIGPTFARHIAYRYYRGEYYAMQVDAQTTFVQDWDEDIISQHEATGNEMAVLSHYPMDISGSIDARTGRALEMERTVMCETHYLTENYLENDVWYLKKGVLPDRGPVLQPFWSAAFSFARGHFAVNVPYDQYMSFLFSEEEISVALRGFSVGYDYYAPSANVCFHTYAKGENEKARKAVPLFWENEKIFGDDVDDARKRVKCMIGLSPEKNTHEWNHVGRELYGLGEARQVTKFFELYGIDPMNKVHEHNLCDFVDGGTMHDTFTQHLRPNGMGIDYGLIDYRFKDGRPKRSQHIGNRNKVFVGASDRDEEKNDGKSPSKPAEDTVRTTDKLEEAEHGQASSDEDEGEKPKNEATDVKSPKAMMQADAEENVEKKEVNRQIIGDELQIIDNSASDTADAKKAEEEEGTKSRSGSTAVKNASNGEEADIRSMTEKAESEEKEEREAEKKDYM